MENSGRAALLRIFAGDEDTWHHKNLARALIEEALNHGLAGATVVRGHEGFGANRHVHTTRLVEIISDLPVVIEIRRRGQEDSGLPARRGADDGHRLGDSGACYRASLSRRA